MDAPVPSLRAEVIAIGDEMTSGQRLDTNSQWISQQLGDLGVEVAFHTTVGDNLADNEQVLTVAAERAELVVITGGLGPTADDLTREALASVAGVPLELHPRVLTHIAAIYRRYGREMPARNRVQALFPQGARVIENPEGTAPGVDLELNRGGRRCRFFALPGVPYEMKQMWVDSVQPAVQAMLGMQGVIHHHVIHCFGLGESQTEEMLPDLIRRGRDPKVGITASFATISLRVSTRGGTLAECEAKMAPTLAQIREILGDAVFGENGATLEGVVADTLRQRGQTVAVVDGFLKGEVARRLLDASPSDQAAVIRGSLVVDPRHDLVGSERFDPRLAARNIREEWQADYGLAIGPLVPDGDASGTGSFSLVIDSVGGTQSLDLPHIGHSKLRAVRSVKQVLNEFRKLLAR